MNKDFKCFQKYFKEYQYRFGLAGYKVYFKYEPLDDGIFANITCDSHDMFATVRLNSVVSKEDKPDRDIRRLAKHEAIHLLLARFDDKARSRYVRRDEIYEVAEELATKLEGLIGDEHRR